MLNYILHLINGRAVAGRERTAPVFNSATGESLSRIHERHADAFRRVARLTGGHAAGFNPANALADGIADHLPAI